MCLKSTFLPTPKGCLFQVFHDYKERYWGIHIISRGYNFNLDITIKPYCRFVLKFYKLLIILPKQKWRKSQIWESQKEDK